MFRFLIPLFPFGNYFFWPLICLITLVSITYGSLSAINQIDLKKVIAYSSIVHMNMAVLGLFTLNIYGQLGSLFLMLAHGLTSAGLFFCVGVLYDRYHTRLITYYSGLVSVMPNFSIFFFIFSISNIGFPGTANFIAELLIFLGISFKNSFVLFSLLPAFFLSVLYSIFVFNRICFGEVSPHFKQTLHKDISFREVVILFLLCGLLLIEGFFPQNILNILEY